MGVITKKSKPSVKVDNPEPRKVPAKFFEFIMKSGRDFSIQIREDLGESYVQQGQGYLFTIPSSTRPETTERIIIKEAEIAISRVIDTMLTLLPEGAPAS